MMEKVLFSSDSDEWKTPQELYKELNDRFKFTLDPCSTEENHLCDKYYTKEENGLCKSWKGERVFVNPPYSKVKQWVEKCYTEHKTNGTTVVMLIPSRTDTRYFHDYIYRKAEIKFIKGRLHFSNSKNSAPFPSMLVIYDEKQCSSCDFYDADGECTCPSYDRWYACPLEQEV